MSLEVDGNSERIIASTWLLASVLLISIFSGELYDSITRQKFIDKIESLEDLLSKEYWINSKIYCMYWFGISIEIYNDFFHQKESILMKLFDRMSALDPFDMAFKRDYLFSVVNDVIHNNSVLSISAMQARYIMNIWKADNDSNKNYDEGIDYYISESNLEPYFIATQDGYFNQTFNNRSSMDNLNAVLVNFHQFLKVISKNTQTIALS